MAGLRVFRSGGHCVFDSLGDTGAVPPTPEATTDASEWFRRGLYLYHDTTVGRLLWYVKASDGVEYQHLAEYVAPELDPDELPSVAQQALEEAATREGWALRTGEGGSESIHPALSGTTAASPATAADIDELRASSATTDPVTLGTADMAGALALYERCRGSYDRVLVAESGTESALRDLPPADIVLVPYESEARGTPVGRTAQELAAAEMESVRETLDRNLSKALDAADPGAVAVELDPPGLEIRPGRSPNPGRVRSAAGAFLAGSALAAAVATLAGATLGGVTAPPALLATLLLAVVGGVGIRASPLYPEQRKTASRLPSEAREAIEAFERATGRLVDNPTVEGPDTYIAETVLADRPLRTGPAERRLPRQVVLGAYCLGTVVGVGLALALT